MVHNVSDMIYALFLLAWRVVLGKYIDTLAFTVYKTYLRPAGTSESRLVNTVSQYTLIMTLTSNPMKDSPYLWLSTLLREYAVILDGFCAMARGVTHTSE